MLNYSPQIPNDSRWELLEAINANRPPDVPPCGYFRGRMAEKNKLKTPSRFYHDVGKFVPEVPAPGATFAGHENHQKETVRLLPRIMIASREVTVNDLFSYF